MSNLLSWINSVHLSQYRTCINIMSDSLNVRPKYSWKSSKKGCKMLLLIILKLLLNGPNYNSGIANLRGTYSYTILDLHY